MSGPELVRKAAAGLLPDWADAGPRRHAHMARVAGLLDEWAGIRGFGEAARIRLRAAAWLHDALRDAEPDSLRTLLKDELAELPDKLLHGPAAAARLREDGVQDEALLRAIAYHTIGHPDFDITGRLLYIADFVEPGRSFRPLWRAVLRSRMPHDARAVLREVTGARIRHVVERGMALRPETLAFWNVITEEP